MSMDKTQFVSDFKAGRAVWNALLDRLDLTQAEFPAAEGALSVKDLIAHVTWYEREMVGLLTSHTLAGSELWSLSTNARNAVIFEQNRARPAADVLSEARSIGQQLTAAIDNLSEEEVCHADHFANMPHDWLPWQVIAGNTYDHYPAHIASIRAKLS